MKQSLLILPFRNLSFSKEDEFLSDGITEELIASLTKHPHLKIASRTSSFFFKGKNFSLEQLREKLAVTHLLEGSIRRQEQQLRIIVHLTETTNGFNEWSETFNFEYRDLLAVQEDIVQGIVRKFVIAPTENLLPTVPHNDITAYEYYLKGLYHYNRYTTDNMRKSVEWLEKAVKKQPTFALAYALMAHGNLGLGGYVHPSFYHKAKKNAIKAIGLNDQLIEPHLSLVYVQMFYDWDWEGAAASIQRALRINLRSAIGHRIKGAFFQVTGQPDLAVEAHEIATKYDPLNVIFLKGLARSLYLSGRYEDAIIEYKKCLQLDPAFRPALEGIGFIEAARGNWQKAHHYFQRYQEMVGHPLKGWFGLGYSSGKIGKVDLAYEILERLDKRKEKYPDETIDLDYAMVYLGLGQFDKVFSYLNNGVDKHHIFTIGCLLSDPMFSDIRSDERYYKLIQKIGLQQYKQRNTASNLSNQILKIQSDTKEQLEIVANQLLYIEADGNYSRFVWRDGNKLNDRLLRITISGILKQVSEKCIAQTHRSFLVNIKNMDTLIREGRSAIFKNEQFSIELPISRNKIASISTLFQTLHSA